ncbi:hypothetical protein NDU88_002856, partial [Pleurodeles waltl]
VYKGNHFFFSLRCNTSAVVVTIRLVFAWTPVVLVLSSAFQISRILSSKSLCPPSVSGSSCW